MIYPAFVFAVAVVVMLAVVIFIVPIFADAFKEAVHDQPGESSTLPTLTQIMVDISSFLKGYWFIWVPAADRDGSSPSSNGRRPTRGELSGTA